MNLRKNMSFAKMKFFIATILLAACAAVQGRSVPDHPMISMMDRGMDTRIIDGTDAQKGQIPWQATLLINTPDGTMLCGGSLIKEDIVLTAAHCVYGAISIEVHLGGVNRWSDMEYNQTSYQFMYHEKYNPTTLENDVALIGLPVPATITTNVQVIQLAARSQPNLVGKSVRVSGYGKTLSGQTSQVLQWVDLTVVDNAQCARYFPNVVPTIICVHGTDHHSACQGDSGGPLVQFNLRPILVGTVSYGKVPNCALGYPSAYSRITSYLNWINQYTGIPIRD